MNVETAVDLYQDRSEEIVRQLRALADRLERESLPRFRPGNPTGLTYTEHTVDLVQEIHAALPNLGLDVLVKRAMWVDNARREQQKGNQ